MLTIFAILLLCRAYTRWGTIVQAHETTLYKTESLEAKFTLGTRVVRKKETKIGFRPSQC